MTALTPAFRATMRRHVRALRRKGMTVRQTAACVGLGHETVRLMDAAPVLFRTVAVVGDDGRAVVVRG